MMADASINGKRSILTTVSASQVQPRSLMLVFQNIVHRKYCTPQVVILLRALHANLRMCLIQMHHFQPRTWTFLTRLYAEHTRSFFLLFIVWLYYCHYFVSLKPTWFVRNPTNHCVTYIHHMTEEWLNYIMLTTVLHITSQLYHGWHNVLAPINVIPHLTQTYDNCIQVLTWNKKKQVVTEPTTSVVMLCHLS